MSGITVLSPVGINRVEGRAIAPRLDALQGIRLGLLNNNKPNASLLEDFLYNLLDERFEVGTVVRKTKGNASIPADGLADYAKEVDAVITAVGD